MKRIREEKPFDELNEEEQEEVTQRIIDLTEENPSLLEHVLERLPPQVLHQVLAPLMPHNPGLRGWEGTFLAPLTALDLTDVSMTIENDKNTSANWINFRVHNRFFRLVQTGHNDYDHTARVMLDLARRSGGDEPTPQLQKLGWASTNKITKLLLGPTNTILFKQTLPFLQETCTLFASLVTNLTRVGGGGVSAEDPILIAVVCEVGLERSLVFLNVMALCFRLAPMVELPEDEESWAKTRKVRYRIGMGERSIQSTNIPTIIDSLPQLVRVLLKKQLRDRDAVHFASHVQAVTLQCQHVY
jgi:hypothetical protein